jgi:hypothetical protein
MHPLRDKFRNERIPKLDEAIDLCVSLGVKFIIDLKDSDENVRETLLCVLYCLIRYKNVCLMIFVI